jgi:hypothetical protein
MTTYSQISLLSVAKQKGKTRHLKRHLNAEKNYVHGTEVCQYCNSIAKDMGLLVDKITH